MQRAGRRGYKGERRYGSVASADPWLAPHVYGLQYIDSRLSWDINPE